MPHLPTRFVVLAHERTGSTLLVRSLRRHRNIRMYGELFHNRADERHAARLYGDEAWEDGSDAAEYVRRVIFRPRWRRSMLAVGFKLFYDHARSDVKAARLWTWLAADRSIRIMHLTRENLFECLVSREVARRTGQWALDLRQRRRTVTPFAIDPHVCADFFESIERWRSTVDLAFALHPVLHFTYERNIISDFQRTVAAACQFLHVPPAAARVPLRKQSLRRPDAVVANYAALKNWFRGTRCARFFEPVQSEDQWRQVAR